MTNYVIIVDDADFIRNIIRKFLSKYDFEVISEISNGKEAVEKYFELKNKLKEKDKLLLIIDIVMPIMNGIESLKHIIKKDPNAKIIMLSALNEQETIINALHNGAKDFLIKPVNKQLLIRTVRRVLAINEVESDKNILIEVYSQIIEDLENYIENPIANEIFAQISYLYQSIELDHPNNIRFDENRNRLLLTENNNFSFQELNELLIDIIQTIKVKVETYIPYGKNLFIESFRFAYLRNHKYIKKMSIKFPPFLETQVKFVNEIMNYFFY